MTCITPILAAVYTSRDNAIALAVESAEGGLMTSLASITRVVVTIGATTIDSAVVGSSVIWWTETMAYRGATVGVIKLKLGGQGVAAGAYDDCSLVIYDSAHAGGLRVENPIKLTVHA